MYSSLFNTALGTGTLLRFQSQCPCQPTAKFAYIIVCCPGAGVAALGTRGKTVEGQPVGELLRLDSLMFLQQT
jgi:hypothetical protein